jgi:predicted amidohydrolase YtcJ
MHFERANMKSCKITFLVHALFALAGGGAALSAGGDETRPMADVILKSANVYTVDPVLPWAQAIAVAGDRIIYVGDDDGARSLAGEDTVVLDLQGKTVMPGFVSAHDHLVSANWLLQGVHLFTAGTIGEALERIRAYAAAHPEERVIRGIGWTMSTFGRYPTAAELDTVVSDRPAILIDYTGHDAWLNSAALRAGDISKDTPDRQPGTTFWVRDDEGHPTGVGVEFEWASTFVAAGAWQPKRMLRESTRELFALAAGFGTTTVQDPGIVSPNALDPEAMKEDFRIAASMLAELDESGDLPLRVQIMPLLKSPKTDPQELAMFAADMMRQYDSDTLRVGSIKIHPAANMESYGSPFIEPYADKHTRGHFGVEPELIRETVLEANQRGVDVVVHVWGDAETRAGIDAIEAAQAAGYREARNSLHHLGFVHPDDYQRIIDLAIPINVTPMFSTDWSGQDEIYTRLLGEKRVFEEITLYPDLARAGVNVSISADTPSSGPYETQAPLYNVESAVTLRAPMDGEQSKPYPPGRQGMSLEQALRAVTIDAAWQLRMEDKIGSLEAGKYADIVILDQNPFEVESMQIHRIKVLGTIMGGKFTHRDGI